MLKRRGEWRLDGRLHPDHQVGNEVYRRNPLDRGHMVRRRDPDGGDHAQQAEEDLPRHLCQGWGNARVPAPTAV